MDILYTVFVIVILFVLSAFLSFITYNNLGCFFAWLLILDCFFVWSGLLPLWSLILLIIINIVYIGIKKYGSVL